MNLTISFKHLEHTPALDQRIREKSEKFKKYLHGSYNVDWVCWISENDHWAEVKVHGGNQDFFAKASAESMYKTLDRVVEKVERQLERQKDQKSRIHRNAGEARIAEMMESNLMEADLLED